MKLPSFKYVYVEDFVLECLKGKSVLHLGCVGDFVSQGPSACLHKHIASVAKEVWGIDVDAEGLATVREWVPEDGNRIRYLQGNVEDLGNVGIDRRFQVIFAGSIIGHLSNPGRMLSHFKRLMTEDAIVVLVTPHAYSLLNCLKVVLKRKEAVHAQHTCWFSVSALSELCSRYGLVAKQWYTGYGYRKPTLKVKAQRAIGVPVFKIFPHLGGSLIGIFKAQYVQE